MKRITYIFLILSMLVGTTSCKDFLEENRFGRLLTEEALESEDSAVLFIYSIYECLGDQYERFWWLMRDVGTDDVVCTQDSHDGPEGFMEHTQSATSYYQTDVDVYEDWWYMVNRCNFVIDKFSESETLGEDFINQSVAEARCMRALAYFNLVRGWGDLPMVDWYVEKENYFYTENLPREDQDVIFQTIIIPDLLFAAENGKDTQTLKGRATKWTAKTILTDVYMTLAGYRRSSTVDKPGQGEGGYYFRSDDYHTYFLLAREQAADILTNCTTHSLITEGGSYSNAYARVWEEEYTSEAILEVGRVAESGRGIYGIWVINNSMTKGFWVGDPYYYGTTGEGRYITHDDFPVYGSGARYMPSAGFYHKFEDGDLRKWGIITHYMMDEGSDSECLYLCEPSFRKFFEIDVAMDVSGTNEYYGQQNIILYRIADVMLFYAEADCEINQAPTTDALEQINILRRRAGLEDAALPATYEDMQVLIRNERSKELHAEGKRRDDLVRWGVLSEYTRNYEINWKIEDNPIYGADGTTIVGYNMLTSYTNQHVHTNIVSSYGCTTTTEAPAYMAKLPLSAEVLSYNPNWEQNKGF